MNLRIVFTALAALILAASCTSGTEGIFASIEREQKIVSLGGLNKSATVTHMAELSGKYYATGGRALFSRSTAAGTSTWDKSTVGGFTEVAAVGVAGTKVWSVAGGNLYSSPDGSSWTKVNLAGGDAVYDLVPVMKNDGFTSTELIVVCGDTASHEFVYKIDNTATIGPRVDLSGTPVISAVASAVFTGTEYYLASESYVWNLNSSFAAPTAVTVTGAPVSGFAGLLVHGSKLYLSTVSLGTTGGGLYSAASASGTSLTFAAIKTNAQTTTGKTVTFGSMLYNAVNASLWVATGASTVVEGTGYAEVSNLSTTPSYSLIPTTNSNNYNSSSLPTSSVSALFRGSDLSYYVGTVAHGLWVWNASTQVWSQQ